jgi:hypothetical protein
MITRGLGGFGTIVLLGLGSSLLSEIAEVAAHAWARARRWARREPINKSAVEDEEMIRGWGD